MPKISRTRRERARKTATNLHQSGKAQKVGYTEAHRRWLMRRIAAYSLIGVGAVMAMVHVVVHLGGLQFLPTLGLQDLLTGYPMALLLAVGGGVLLGTK